MATLNLPELAQYVINYASTTYNAVSVPPGSDLPESSCHDTIIAQLQSMQAAGTLVNDSSITHQDNIDALFLTASPTLAMLYQTSTYRHSNSVGNGLMYEYLTDLGFGDYIRNQQPGPGGSGTDRTFIYAREAYTVEGGALGGSGGPGGIRALDPELIAGNIYEGPEVDQRKFDIYYAVQAGFLPARRPGIHGGIAMHPERYATFRIMSIDGEVIYATTNISIEDIQSSRKESVNFTRSTDGYVGSFSEEGPQVSTVSGKLIDCQNFDWMRSWEQVYDKLARGSVLARRKWRVYILYKATIIGGYLLNSNLFENAVREPEVPFSFQMYITDRIPLPRMNVYSQNGQNFQRFKGTSEQFYGQIGKLVGSADTQGLLQTGVEYALPSKPLDPEGSATDAEAAGEVVSAAASDALQGES